MARPAPVDIDEETIPVPGTVRFPVELTPPEGFDPARLETWPRVEGRLEWVGGRLLYMPPGADRVARAARATRGRRRHERGRAPLRGGGTAPGRSASARPLPVDGRVLRPDIAAAGQLMPGPVGSGGRACFYPAGRERPCLRRAPPCETFPRSPCPSRRRCARSAPSGD